LSGDEILSIKSADWLVPDLLVENTLAAIHGAPGSCKTFLALDLALHVSAGRDWRGRGVKPGSVLYVTAEGCEGMAPRVLAWESRHGKIGSDVFWLPHPVSLMRPPEVEQLVEVVSQHKPVLTVFDTFARCTVGADENSSRDMGMAIEALDLLRRATGGCVLVVHHSGKDSSRGMRGSTALEAAFDTDIRCSYRSRKLTATVVKQRNSSDGSSFCFALQETLSSGVLVSTADMSYGEVVADLEPLMELVSKAVEDSPGASVRDLRRLVRARDKDIANATDALVQLGNVLREGGSRGAYLHRSMKPFRTAAASVSSGS
jgi:hypothetical protein